jgi:tryptophan-rich sensory protein
MVIISGFVLLGLFSALDGQSIQYLDYVEKISYRISIIAFPVVWIVVFGIFLVTVLSLIRSLRYGYRASVSVLIVGFIISSIIVAMATGLLFGNRATDLAHTPVIMLENFIWSHPNRY